MRGAFEIGVPICAMKLVPWLFDEKRDIDYREVKKKASHYNVWKRLGRPNLQGFCMYHFTIYC